MDRYSLRRCANRLPVSPGCGDDLERRLYVNEIAIVEDKWVTRNDTAGVRLAAELDAIRHPPFLEELLEFRIARRHSPLSKRRARRPGTIHLHM